MNCFRVLVIGTGSIGYRHINNFLRLGCAVHYFSYTNKIIPDQDYAGRLIREENLSNAVKKSFDGIIIANITDKHLETLISVIYANSMNKKILIEKPISNNMDLIDSAKKLIEKNELNVSVGYMLRQHPNLLAMKRCIDMNLLGKILYADFHVGQDLRDWRVGIDHTTHYSAFDSMGGGVILELSHEIDLALWMFGGVEEICAMIARADFLGIQSESIAKIIMRTKSTSLVSINLDWVRLGYRRDCEIVGEMGVLSWNFLEGKLRLFTDESPAGVVIDEVPENFQRNDMYLKMSREFLAANGGSCGSNASFDDGVKALKIALSSLQQGSINLN